MSDNKMTAEKALERFGQDLLPDPHDERDIDASWIRRRWEKYEPAIRQALSAPRVPHGWRLVPYKFSEEMFEAAASFGGSGGYSWLRGRTCEDAWPHILSVFDDAMLSASPEPVAPSIDDYVNLCAAMYQAAGARNLPVRFLDALSEAQSGEPFAHLIQGLLPVSEDEEGAFCPDAKNYESMFMQAVKSIAEISVAVGVPDDEAEAANGNDEILHYIGLIKSERDYLRAEVEALREALGFVKIAILEANDSGIIADTLWATPQETLIDYIDAARLREGGA